MNLQTLLSKKNMTMYRLSKESGVGKSTVIDICSGKSTISNCKAETVLKLSKVLGCTMEELMQIDNAEYDYITGKPKNKSYLEKGLPNDLLNSIKKMEESWKIIDSGKEDLHWDIWWCELNADINSAEVDNVISSEQASYLRSKYLRMEN